jgi:hypothetical protein
MYQLDSTAADEMVTYKILSQTNELSAGCPHLDICRFLYRSVAMNWRQHYNSKKITTFIFQTYPFCISIRMFATL